MVEQKEEEFALKTKEVVIGKNTYKVKELSWKDKNEIRKSTIKYDSNTGKTEVDVYTASEKRLLKGLVSAPFDINEENIGKLRETVARKLLDEINALSELTEEEIKK